MTVAALNSCKVGNFALFQPNFGNLAHFSYCWLQKLSLAVWLNFGFVCDFWSIFIQFSSNWSTDDHNLRHFSLQGKVNDIAFSSELQCLPKVLQHLCKFCLVLRFPPLPLRTMLCCGKKIGMIGRSVTLLECWDNNLRNQHCFGGEGVFEPDGYG